mmetsp:Transcript_84/g.286  ORF Transcript_84/g.286 Transcript_84/m.286 type:complete len:675 (+) Transcript_84:222-2246(+)
MSQPQNDAVAQSGSNAQAATDAGADAAVEIKQTSNAESSVVLGDEKALMPREGIPKNVKSAAELRRQKMSFQKKTPGVIEEQEWFVACNEAGSHELVQAVKNGRMPVNQCTVMTEDLVGFRYGECFDLKLLEGETRSNLLADSIFTPRFTAEKEKRFTILGKVYKGHVNTAKKQKKQAGATAASKPNEEHPSWAVFSPVKCDNTVGCLPQASSAELALRRVQLLEALHEVEDDLGMGRTLPSDAEQVSSVKMRTNEHLVDVGRTNEPSLEEMERMRATMTEEEIIQKLTTTSESFANKTEYSQEKFRRGKLQKHSRKMRILPVNGITIGATLWNTVSETGIKFANFRFRDVLPQVLAMGNVQAGARPLVVDSTEGIIIGAMLERMGGFGRLYSGHFDTGWSDLRMLQFFNPSPEQISCLREVNLSELVQDCTGEEPLVTLESKLNRLLEQHSKIEERLKSLNDQIIGAAASSAAAVSEQQDEATVSAVEERSTLEKNLRAVRMTIRGTRSKLPTKAADAQENKEIFDELRAAQATSLILVTKYEIRRSFLNLLPYIRPGAPFVIFSEVIDPLVELREEIANKLAVGLAITETFCREQQVLPSRTHPLMNMSGRSGFLLSGHKIDPESDQVRLVHVRARHLGAYKNANKSDKEAAKEDDNNEDDNNAMETASNDA